MLSAMLKGIDETSRERWVSCALSKQFIQQFWRAAFKAFQHGVDIEHVWRCSRWQNDYGVIWLVFIERKVHKANTVTNVVKGLGERLSAIALKVLLFQDQLHYHAQGRPCAWLHFGIFHYLGIGENAMKIKLFLISLVCIPAMATAQMFVPSFDMGPIMVGQALQPMVDRAEDEARGQSGSASSPKRARAPASVDLTYTPSLTRRRENYAQFVAKTRKADPAGADQLAAMLNQTDVIAAMGPPLTKFGLRTDNVADAYSIYWMNAWQAAHGDTTQYGRETISAVKAQAARAIGATAKFAEATESNKQELAEAFLIQGAMIEAFQLKFKAAPDLMRRLGDTVRKGAKATGIDLDAMTLTSKGFVPAGRTGETGPAAGH